MKERIEINWKDKIQWFQLKKIIINLKKFALYIWKYPLFKVCRGKSIKRQHLNLPLYLDKNQDARHPNVNLQNGGEGLSGRATGWNRIQPPSWLWVHFLSTCISPCQRGTAPSTPATASAVTKRAVTEKCHHVKHNSLGWLLVCHFDGLVSFFPLHLFVFSCGLAAHRTG